MKPQPQKREAALPEIDTPTYESYTGRMSAKDLIHNAVKRALIKEGWKITDDPLTLKYGGVTMFADLAAELPLAAERGDLKIAVEIKSFLGRSAIQDVQEALGQYVAYRTFLEVLEPDRKLYVAISDVAFATTFHQAGVQLLVERNNVPLIIVNPKREEIVQWTS